MKNINWLKVALEKLKALRKNPVFLKLLTVVSIIYPLVLIYFSKDEILNINWQSFSKFFLLSLLIYYISMGLQNVNWSLIVDGNLKRFWFNSQIYFQTVLMRRLPGGIWHWLGRLSFYESSGLENNPQITSSNFIEWSLLILSGLAVYLFTINYIFGGIAFLILISISSVFFIKRHMRNAQQALFLSISILMLYGICWLAGSLILHYLIIGINEGIPFEFSNSITIWCLSSAFSMIFFFFPSGAIIRDFTLGALLSKEFEPAKALLVILQVRILFLAADYLWSFLSLQFIKIITRDSITKAN